MNKPLRHQYDYTFLMNDLYEQKLPEIKKETKSIDYKKIKNKIKFLDKKEHLRLFPIPKSLSQKQFFWARDQSNTPKYCESSEKRVQNIYYQYGDCQDNELFGVKTTIDLSSSTEMPKIIYNQQIPLIFGKKENQKRQQEIVSERSNSTSFRSDLTIGRYHRPMRADNFYHVINPLKQDIKPNRQEYQTALNSTFNVLQDLISAPNMRKQSNGLVQENTTTSEIKSRNDEEKVTKASLTKQQIVRKCIINYIKKLKRCKLTHNQVLKDNVFSNNPYEKQGSFEFFEAIKNNNERIVLKLLSITPYLVYDFDNAQMTGLHWAAKRGSVNIVKLLISYNSDVDAKDLVDRTALYIAADYTNGKEAHKYIEIIQILLYNQATPWSYDHIKYSNVIRENQMVKQLFAISRRIHIILLLTPSNLKDTIWNKEVPAMAAIKNFDTSLTLKQNSSNDLFNKYPHMEPRLKQMYMLKLKILKKKIGNQAEQEIDKQIQNEQLMFNLIRNR